MAHIFQPLSFKMGAQITTDFFWTRKYRKNGMTTIQLLSVTIIIFQVQFYHGDAEDAVCYYTEESVVGVQFNGSMYN